mmetsp:Transcript_8430/g.14674  ORF Transcript_8430/g.14674 Transcript_8430/m.14674 type:complete len:81 (-) Transcript_8430:369-611(-)|eukprot:CAMPEP_0183707132 /NCGR_PEP_ID=MMETSP0737-20130205/3776_1 /TAXON_ID=385413 /ORGANISM="Thalassiosira miniscula, Strain CCMP1093" /LENGTH=80 /DNA_ID=CAMNT_0025934713 /DNA_START=133 /DNA_END=375 /DNA_ORIENTATION=-
MALTKTNTDTLCPPTVGNPILIYLQKLKYRYFLWTGLYMLETHEKIAFHFVAGPVMLAFFVYVGVFGRGIVEGWKEAGMA